MSVLETHQAIAWELQGGHPCAKTLALAAQNTPDASPSD